MISTREQPHYYQAYQQHYVRLGKTYQHPGGGNSQYSYRNQYPRAEPVGKNAGG